MPRSKVNAHKHGGASTGAHAATSKDAVEPAAGSQKRLHTDVDDSLDEPEVVLGPRRAKANALQNQVWLKADGSTAAQKKLASTAQPAGARKRRNTKKRVVPQTPRSNDNCEKENTSEPVSIPVPKAPRKPQPAKKKRSSADGCLKSVNNDHDPFTDGGGTVTPSIAGSDADAEDEDDEECVSDTSGLAEISADPRLLKKTLSNERPIWPDDKGRKLKPALKIKSVPMVVKHSKGSDDNGSGSPTERLVSESSQRSKGKKALRHWKPFVQPEDLFPPDIDSDDSRATEPVWPGWTDLVVGLNGNIKLTDQEMEIQGVLRRSMAIIEERIIFDHSFPRLIVREGWNRRAVQQACKEKEGFAPASIKTKYRTIRERSEAEWHYMKEIQSLLDPRISHFRGGAKTSASSNIKLYGIFKNNTVDRALVNDLLFKSQYIYVAKGRDYDRSKAYEHEAIIEVLHAVYFPAGGPINVRFSERFKPEEVEAHKIEPAMIALAATGIHCALDEWRDGTHRQVKFGIQSYTGTYETHMKALGHIKSKNEQAYQVLLRKLFRRACMPSDASGVVLDIDNMDVQD